MNRRNWQRNELLLVLNLYCRLPFGRYHNRNAEIIQLAELIGRTPNAVAMKLTNFASFDPYHQSRGVSGLQNTSQADREIWDEFNKNWGELAAESELAYLKLAGQDNLNIPNVEEQDDMIVFSGTTETERQVKVRLGQRFFRKVILANYQNKCCVCGIPVPKLLIASHIVPWHKDKNLRVNPHNGLCLCTLHDKAFDAGFFTLGENFEIVIGEALLAYLPNPAVQNGFNIFLGQKIELPDKFLPAQEFLEVHRKNYYLG